MKKEKERKERKKEQDNIINLYFFNHSNYFILY